MNNLVPNQPGLKVARPRKNYIPPHEYTFIGPGLNYEIRCNNKECDRFNDVDVVIKKGFGVFDVVQEAGWGCIKCPQCKKSASLDRIILWKANYTIHSQLQDQDKPKWINGKTKYSRFIDFKFAAETDHQQNNNGSNDSPSNDPFNSGDSDGDNEDNAPYEKLIFMVQAK